MENTEENNEKIQKIWKKIVKRFGKYKKKVSWIVKKKRKYGIPVKVRWIEKR